jgi:hypothetical protein
MTAILNEILAKRPFVRNQSPYSGTERVSRLQLHKWIRHSSNFGIPIIMYAA